jgi:DNA-binding winged helix-turn-helix (wHTH) protein/tetratricopeptide (TPR) repeat protein
MSAETKVLYEFGKFRCDPREHLLLCDGKPVSLSPKSFDILLALIRSNGQLLMKDELMRQVWPDSFVEEANLTVNISALRKVLGETPGGQQYIETVPKRGYRFVAPVKEFRSEGPPAPGVQTLEPENRGLVAPTSPTASIWLRRWWLAAALLLVAVLVSVLVSSRNAVLTDKDTVVLADFTNSTGDSVFDGALRQGLSAQLEQSPFLNLLSDQRIAQTLSLMAQPKDAHLTRDLAREVCQRTASAAVLDGAIAQVGTQYLLTLKAVNCSTGDSLGSTEAQAQDKNHVLDALSKLASEMRSKLGESLASVQKYDAPPENVTTPSLDALKAYSLGYQATVVKSDSSAAIPLFQQAISLDPNFAMAYARMGTSYFNLYQTVRATESLRRAYELREHLSERERLYIASHYQIVVTGNLDAARKVFELLTQTYPREAPYTNLGIVYSQLGDYDLALAAFEKAVRMGPATGNRYANLVNGYLQLNRLDEAKATVREAQAKGIDSPEIHVNLYWADFLQNDVAGMEREAASVESDRGYQYEMLNRESETALYRGQLAKARMLAQRAVESARKEDEKEAAAVYEAQAAVREALVGNMDLAKQAAQTALASSNGRDAEALSAIAMGMAGDSKAAGRLADDLAKRFPEDTIVQFHYLPTIHAAALLRGRDGSVATDSLAATPYELGGNLLTLNFILYPVYVHGEAYLTEKKGEAAAAEFQKILDHPGAVRNEPIAALAHLQLGRAYAVSGQPDKAKSSYNEFLTLWKDADSDIPILKEAKAEYAKLR